MGIGQNINEWSLRLNYGIGIPINNNIPQSINFYPVGYFPQPAFLSQLNPKSSLEIGVIYSRLSRFYTPEIIFKYSSFHRLPDRSYKSIDISSFSVGLGSTFRLFQSRKLMLSTNLNLLLNRSKLTSEAYSNYLTGGDRITYLLHYNPRNIDFTSSTVELTGNFEYFYSKRLSVEARLGLSMISFPDFDIPSPTFFKVPIVLFGIKYHLIKNKYFNYSL
ncbi:MAG: hypothetical protein DWQ02_12660 [Bacteroidetes bacterium]|nr:MAG: hypothetical protein DWQ02_12660 [Bacteroidota bacterium]